MRVTMTPRDRALLIILLVVVAALCAYQYLFRLPTEEKMANYQSEIAAVEDSMILSEAKLAQLRQMEAELAAIFAAEDTTVKEMPTYDNSRNVMQDLHMILANVLRYDLNFAEVSIEGEIAHRDIDLEFLCGSYEEVKSVLVAIHSGKYRCALKDLSLTQTGDGYQASVRITYYEYYAGEEYSV